MLTADTQSSMQIPVLSPTIATKKPMVTKELTQKLPFSSNQGIGFSDEGVLIEHDDDNNKLNMLQLITEPSYAYISKFEASRPKEVKHGSAKYIMDDKIIMRHTDNTTFILNNQLQLINSFTGEYGWLHGTLSPDFILYSQELDDKREMSFYRTNDHSLAQKLSQTVQSRGVSLQT